MINAEAIEWASFTIGTIGTILWAAEYRLYGCPIEAWFWLASSLLRFGNCFTNEIFEILPYLR